MTKDQAGEFCARLTALAELFHTKMSEAVQVLYFEALSDLELDDLAMAMSKSSQSCKFMPKPVELREIILGNPTDRAEIGWLAWREAAKRIGGGASLVVEDAPLAETLVAVFGSWPSACGVELSSEMWSSKRKEFERVYRVMVIRNIVGIRYLAGTHELHNSTRREWQKHTPVGCIDLSGNVRQLSGEQADMYRLKEAPKELLP